MSLERLAAAFPTTDRAALHLVLDECRGDVDASIAMIARLQTNAAALASTRSFRVLFSHSARSVRELTVVRGEIVDAVDSTDADNERLPWLQVDRRAEIPNSDGLNRGFVPRTYLRLLTRDIGAVATRDYQCGEGKVGHLPFRRDDKLILLSRIPAYEWWYALLLSPASPPSATPVVGRVPITLLRVDSNADVFAVESERTSVPVVPTVDPPIVCGGADDLALDDALTDAESDDNNCPDNDNSDGDDPLFNDPTFVRAEQSRRQILLEAGDVRVDEAQRELTEWAMRLRRQRDESSSSSSSDEGVLWLNAAQRALVLNGLARKTAAQTTMQ